jgi:hypothetical protein
MKTSEKIDLIAPAVLAAQKEINNASKDANNPHYKSYYASLGSVIEAVKDPLNKHGICVMQSLSDGSEGLYLTTRLLHQSGQWIEDVAFTPLPKLDPQGVGSACTYLRRYSLAALLCITQEDDDGNGAVRHEPDAIKRISLATASKVVAKPNQDDPF